MAYTTINKSSDYFNTKLYSGTGSSNAITGVGFQPDWVWVKNRTGTNNHRMANAVSGSSEVHSSNITNVGADSSYFSSFDSDGFTVGTASDPNVNGGSFASWNWKAGASQTLTTGNVTSTVRANTTAGFSIVKWTGTAGNILVSHGLGAIPKVVMIKNLSNGSAQWVVYHVGTGNTQACYLNTNAAPTATTGFFNNSNPDATDFIVSSDTAVNGSGNTMIAYCFAEKTGYSKFGSYIGNGNADGIFVYTGFKPQLVIFKNSSITQHWLMMDTKRDPYNVMDTRLYPSQNNGDTTNSAYYVDYLSNGFKIKTNSVSWNGDGNNIIYMAFAEAPLVGTNGVTAKAR